MPRKFWHKFKIHAVNTGNEHGGHKKQTYNCEKLDTVILLVGYQII